MTYAMMVAATGVAPLPEGLDVFWNAYLPGTEPFLRLAFLEEMCTRYDLPEAQANRLQRAYQAITEDDTLHAFARFLSKDMCAARHRCDVGDYHAMQPTCLKEGADCFAFLLLMSCIEPSLNRVRATGMPEALFQDIPFTFLEKQMAKIKDKGEVQVADFPWEMNFYTCSIFLLDRFLFIPFRFEEPIAFYRNNDGDVHAFFTDGCKIRRDGLLDGVNGQTDPEAFPSQYEINDTTVSGTPILPCGIVSREVVTIDLSHYTLCLQENDLLLGTHIPSGPGYTPERLQTSGQLARDLFASYFPEIPVKGLSNESWLNDPHLYPLLPEGSNIRRMQDNTFLFPMHCGDEMGMQHLFSGEGGRESTLKGAVRRLTKRVKLTTGGMLVLMPDIDHLGACLYRKPADRALALEGVNVPW